MADQDGISPRAAYESRRWTLWKFALGGTVLAGISYLANRAEEAEFYRSMYLNDLEVVIQVAAYIGTGLLLGLLLAAVQNVWVWHRSGNRDGGRPHFVLAAVIASFALYTLVTTLGPYYR